MGIDKQALERVAHEASRKRVAQMQQVLDSVHRAYAGQPIAEVRPALEAACQRGQMTPDAEQLDSWSQAISQGERLVLEVNTTGM